MNEKAEKLTGLNTASTLEKPLAEAFRLVIAQDGRPADDALELALAAEGSNRLYTDHALVSENTPPLDR